MDGANVGDREGREVSSDGCQDGLADGIFVGDTDNDGLDDGSVVGAGAGDADGLVG